MKAIRTFGRFPTLGEMKEYYARDDVLSFLYDECQMRNIVFAFKKKRWPINPTSKASLRKIIENAIESRIERAYSAGLTSLLDSIRLKPFDYLSFHSLTSITSGKKLIGFDTIFEADSQGWRQSFEDLVGVVKLLDDFGVCYRIKYSGVRSLHLMIPFEALPKQFNGESILSQQAEIQSKIRDYFHQHCGMEEAHGGKVLRLAYSLNEDNGLVSLPLLSAELPSFRPWESNIHNVTVDKPWHGDIPADAGKKALDFLREVYSDDAEARKTDSRKMSIGLDIIPKAYSDHSVKLDKHCLKEWVDRLKSGRSQDRAEAAWNIMTTTETVPISMLEEGLTDENPDVRWYLTEALQKNLGDDAISLAGRMLADSDQFVRISAMDALVLAGENALSVLWNSVAGDVSAYSKELFSEFAYAVGKISAQDESQAVKSFTQSEGSRIVAHSLQEAVASNQPGSRLRRYMRHLREICRRSGIEESIVFSDASRVLAPKLLRGCGDGADKSHLYVLVLQELHGALSLMTIREIAMPFGIDPVYIPSDRVTEAEQKFLQAIVRNALADMSIKQKTRILALFMLHGKNRLIAPSAKVLLKIGMSEAVEAMVEMSTQKTVFPDRLVNAVNDLKQLEPSLEGSTPAARALDQIGGSGAVPRLVEVLRSEDMQFRRSAARALAQISNATAIPVLVEAIGDKDKVVRREAISAMERVGQPAIPSLIATLRESEEPVRLGNAALVLGRIGGSDAVPTLVHVLEDERRDVRAKAISALGATGDAAAVPLLIDALRDRYTFVRSNAADALKEIGDPSAVPALIKALDDKKSSVRAQVAGALGALGDSAAVPALTRVLTDENHPWPAACAAMALGEIGDPAAVSALAEIISAGDDDWLFGFAVKALKNMGTPEAMQLLSQTNQ